MTEQTQKGLQILIIAFGFMLVTNILELIDFPKYNGLISITSIIILLIALYQMKKVYYGYNMAWKYAWLSIILFFAAIILFYYIVLDGINKGVSLDDAVGFNVLVDHLIGLLKNNPLIAIALILMILAGIVSDILSYFHICRSSRQLALDKNNNNAANGFKIIWWLILFNLIFSYLAGFLPGLTMISNAVGIAVFAFLIYNLYKLKLHLKETGL